jgi:AcrR family transcriptional regulator
MPQSPIRKALTRTEIFGHAARLFRLRGYAGTNIDDIMLAAGLTRGAFYAHFKSKDDLFAEVVRAGDGLLAQLRAPGSKVLPTLDAYLAKEDLAANAQFCTLAALPGDVARAPLAAQLAYANGLYALIAEMARGRKRKLDADATAAAILALGAIGLARASGDRRLSDWLLRCARLAARALLRPPRPSRPSARRASPKPKRSRSRRKGVGARQSKRAGRSRGGRA